MISLSFLLFYIFQIYIFRDNLDPKKKYSDDVLWHSLEMVQLKDLVKSFSNGLGDYNLYYFWLNV